MFSFEIIEKKLKSAQKNILPWNEVTEFKNVMFYVLHQTLGGIK
jgi:hypothetical protein